MSGMLRAECKQYNLGPGSRVNGPRESLELGPHGEGTIMSGRYGDGTDDKPGARETFTLKIRLKSKEIVFFKTGKEKS